jgi:hypothetical protein
MLGFGAILIRPMDGEMILDGLIKWSATGTRRHSTKHNSAAILTWFHLSPFLDLASQFTRQIFRFREREGWIIEGDRIEQVKETPMI